MSPKALSKEKAGSSPRSSLARSPRLDTVLMVERAIKKYDGEFKRRALWEHLPKKMMYQTFKVIIDYLLHSRRISIDADGKVGWIYYLEKARYSYKRKDLSVDRFLTPENKRVWNQK